MAIEQLVDGLNQGSRLKCCSGHWFGQNLYDRECYLTAAASNVNMAPNKTLAAQLYGEFKGFFKNAVEYFVSYYDYYQPEAYVPSSDTYIEKDAVINDHIEQSGGLTKALLERRDALVVASVLGIYGLVSRGLPQHGVIWTEEIVWTSDGCCGARGAPVHQKRNGTAPRDLSCERRCHRYLPAESTQGIFGRAL